MTSPDAEVRLPGAGDLTEDVPAGLGRIAGRAIEEEQVPVGRHALASRADDATLR